jgi:hypothetical protein
MISDATKLGGEGSFGTLKLNLFVQVVQLVVLSEDIYSGPTPTRSNNPDKLTNLDDGIRRKLMRLYSEFTQNAHKDQMWQHPKPSSEEVFEHDGFIHSRLRHRLHTRSPAIFLGKIAGVTLHRHEASLHDNRLTKIIAYPSQNSQSYLGKKLPGSFVEYYLKMIKIEKKIPRVRSSSRAMSCSRLDGASLLCSSPPQPPKALYILDEERSICLLSKVRNYYIGLKNKENIHHCCYKYPVYPYTFIKIAHHYFYKKKTKTL